MTDHEKLQAIERICREAFSPQNTWNVDLYRAQALANVYGIFLYDGATISNIHEAVDKYRDDNQLTIDELLNQGLPTSDCLEGADFMQEVVKHYREPVSIRHVAQLKHRIELARHTGIHEIFPMVIKMSKQDCYELLGILRLIDDNGGLQDIIVERLGHHSFMEVPIIYTEEHGIRLCIETALTDELL